MSKNETIVNTLPLGIVEEIIYGCMLLGII